MVKSKVKKPVSETDEKKSARLGRKPAHKQSDRIHRKESLHAADAGSNASPQSPANPQANARANGEATSSKERVMPSSIGSEIIKSHSGIDLTEKIKELVRLAQEQGYLTYGDINDALPDNVVTPEDLDEIYIKLRNLDVEIVDQAEVDRVKQPEPEEEEDKSRLDILDDPVRMYL